MIRVTVELLPLGDESRARHLGTAEIVNDGSGTSTMGNYRVRLSKWGRPKECWKKGVITGFPRKTRGPWDLLFRGLSAVVANRNTSQRRSR